MKAPLLLFLLAGLAAPLFLTAQEGTGGTTNPSWMRNLTRDPPGPYAELRPVLLEYNLTWKNTVKAGEMAVKIVPAPNERIYLGNASGKSTGLARALFPYDFKAVSRVSAGSLRPTVFAMNEEQRKSRSSYEIQFTTDRTLFQTTKQNTEKPGSKPVTRKTGFDHDFTQDLMSAVFYLRSQPLKQGDKVSLVVAPQNRAYLTQARVAGREKRRVRGKSYSTIKLDLGIAKIDDDLSLKPYSKVDSATVWITDDAYRLPLEMQADIFIGFVSARLTGRRWLGP